MKTVYSKSQGKLIQIEDTPTQIQQPTQPSSGLSSDMLKKAALLDVGTTGGKNLATLTALQSFFPETKVTQEDIETKKKAALEVTDTIDNIDTVLGKNLSSVSGIGAIGGLIPSTKAYTTRGQIKQIKDQLSLASVGKLKGQGQISDAERAILSNAVSNIKFGMNPDDLRNELIKVKGILNRNIGGIYETPNPESTNEGGQSLPGMAISGVDAISKFLFPATRKAFSAEGLANANPMDTSNVDLSKTKGNLGESLKAVGQNFMPSFSKYLGVVAPAGVEVGVAAKTLPKVISKGKATVEGIKTLTPKGAVANRAAIASKSTAKLSGSNIIKAGEEYVTNDPTAKKLLEKIAPTLEKKTLSSTQLLEKLKVWNKAFTAAGKVGKSSKAGLYETLARAAKEELAQKAPDVLVAQGKLAKAMGRSKTISKIFNPTTIASGAVMGGSYAALNKLLGIGKQASQ